MKLDGYSILRRFIDDVSWSIVSLPLFVLAFIGIGEAGFIPTYIAALFVYYASRIVAQFLYWRRSSYFIENGKVTMSWGVIRLRTRTVPVENVQQINVFQDWLSRLMGLAKLTIAAPGDGKQSRIELEYITENDIEGIQRRLEYQDGWATDTESEQTTLYEGSVRGIVIRGLTSLHLKYLLPAIIAIAIVAADLVSFSVNQIPVVTYLPDSSHTVFAAGGIIFLLLWGIGAINTVFMFHGLTITRVGNTLRSRAGAIYSFSTNIPLENIQAMRISSNFLQRAIGYSELTVSSAANPEGAGFPFRKPLIPLEEVDAVEEVAHRILRYQAIPLERPPKRMRRRYLLHYATGIFALSAISLAGTYPWFGITVVAGAWPLPFLVFGPPLAHLNWQSRGIGVHNNLLVLRRGVVRQHTYVVPLDRIQRVSVRQSLFQRRADLATISVEIASPVLSIGLHAADFDVRTAESVRTAIENRLERDALDQGSRFE